MADHLELNQAVGQGCEGLSITRGKQGKDSTKWSAAVEHLQGADQGSGTRTLQLDGAFASASEEIVTGAQDDDFGGEPRPWWAAPSVESLWCRAKAWVRAVCTAIGRRVCVSDGGHGASMTRDGQAFQTLGGPDDTICDSDNTCRSIAGGDPSGRALT